MTPKRAATLIALMGWGFIIFGIIYVTIAFPALDGFSKALSQLFDWTGLTAADDLSRSARWFAAIMSGLSAGFGAFYVFLVVPLLQHQDLSVFRTVRRGGLIAAGLWFVIDSIGSVAAGVPSNVAPNILFLAMFAVPLLIVKYES
jgi:quinol-cytochrome oxidoreductase complex cytochrome b subunit